jgi:2-dehydropantoate 2-reductase
MDCGKNTMHIAVVGAGALGSVYGVRLAACTRAAVSFVVRPARAESREPITIEQGGLYKRGLRERIEQPERGAHIARNADLVLLAVGTEHLEETYDKLRETDAPIVVLSPMMPADFAKMRRAFGDRVHAAMPTVVAYASGGQGDRGSVVRYWLIPSPTRIDLPCQGRRGQVVRSFANALDQAGLATQLEARVYETNPATTVCFLPMAMAISIAGGVEALCSDADLLAITAKACRESVRLARRIGRPLPFATLAPLAASAPALRSAVAMLRRLSPEALSYLDLHFGQKLRTQNDIMLRNMVDLARDKDLPHSALRKLGGKLP